MSVQRDIQRQIAKARKDLEAIVRETTGADSEPVRKAASVLARRWRKLLSVPKALLGPDLANGPPRERTGKLRKSIKTAVVDGVRRVGTNDFRARLFEFGGYAARDGAPQPPRPHAQVALEQVQDQMTDVLVSDVQRRVAQGDR